MPAANTRCYSYDRMVNPLPCRDLISLRNEPAYWHIAMPVVGAVHSIKTGLGNFVAPVLAEEERRQRFSDDEKVEAAHKAMNRMAL